jgi:hypothetical protein
MENINENSTVEENIETPVVEETPEVVETPVVEAPVAEAPVVEQEPTAIDTSDFGKSTSEVQAVGQVDNGAIGVTAAPVAPKQSKKSKMDAEEKVAIRSTKNVSWSEVGKVYVGINIVPASAAEKWLTRSHISLATPEEVAKEFGK